MGDGNLPHLPGSLWALMTRELSVILSEPFHPGTPFPTLPPSQPVKAADRTQQGQPQETQEDGCSWMGSLAGKFN